ncbi:ABC-three component system protein [Streptomyces sp. CL7]|uniref:ABC-three component system protein n=1 Tax=Streptomyces sp. CL7 TaxID=3096006 RepID=UPI002A755DCB|nr:ABC-three component system protein [Streptomyces sp. CL7]WPP32273.1 ABC-three component system protein [Streptomyces sp. CL7]
MPASVSHDASASALGYLFQAQWGLYELLQGAEERPDGAISLELHDDVAWEEGARAVDLLQTKFHPRSTRSLGDKDDDVWRTIRSWMDTHDPGDADGPWLTLVTTQRARNGSAMAALRGDARSPDVALLLLEDAARTSEAEGSQAVRQRFLDLSPADRGVFVRRMRVVDGVPSIEDLDAAVRRKLLFSLPSGEGPQTALMRQLWAWWYEQAVAMLQKRITSVSVEQVHRQIEHLRDDYTTDRLPTLVSREDWEAAQEQGVSYAEACFVHQLRWVSVSQVQLDKAIMDYYRAFTQAVLWVDDDLVAIGELERYQENLVDEWERAFDWMVEDLPPDATDVEREQAGKQLLRTTLDRVTVKVRERYDEVFFHRGTHHCLADQGRLGWHPEFLQRVQQLTGSVHA